MLDVLERSLSALEERLDRSSLAAMERIAAFDLDGTLLDGDIGEAVFAFLLSKRFPLELNWAQYRNLLGLHKSMAYRAVVSAMSGLHMDEVAWATDSVMNLDSAFIDLGGAQIPVPRPRPEFQRFLKLLRRHNFRSLVLSASNHISVQQVTRLWFDIPPSDAIGIQNKLSGDTLTHELVVPIPVGAGKVAALRKLIGNTAPLITGSDGALDLPLLRSTLQIGFSIWVGNDRVEFDAVRGNADSGLRFVLAELLPAGKRKSPEESEI